VSDGAHENIKAMEDSSYFYVEHHINCLLHLFHNSITAAALELSPFNELIDKSKSLSSYFRASPKRMN